MGLPFVLTLAILQASVVWAVVDHAQVQALVDLASATNVTGWTNSSGWLNGDPCRDAWYGVGCDEDRENIGGLYLYDNGLDGTLPSSLSSLNALADFEIYGNNVGGTIPDDIFVNMTFLERVVIHDNQLKGSLPSSLFGMYNIRVLYAGFNQFSGSLSQHLGNLQSLAVIDLSFNEFSGQIPGNLTQLSAGSLNLQGNLFDSFPSDVYGWDFEEVLLGRNQIEGTIPSEFGTTNSFKLDLSYNQLTGTIPSELGELANLSELYLDHNKLTGSVPSQLVNCEQVVVFELSSNALSGTFPEVVEQFSNLHYLNLAHNAFHGELPEFIVNQSYFQSYFPNLCSEYPCPSTESSYFFTSNETSVTTFYYEPHTVRDKIRGFDVSDNAWTNAPQWCINSGACVPSASSSSTYYSSK